MRDEAPEASSLFDLFVAALRLIFDVCLLALVLLMVALDNRFRPARPPHGEQPVGEAGHPSPPPGLAPSNPPRRQ